MLLFQVRKATNFLKNNNDLKVSNPTAGAMGQNLVFEVIPDDSASSIYTQVCKTKISFVGRNLPCIKAFSVQPSNVLFEKTNAWILGNVKRLSSSKIIVTNL